MVKVCPSSCVRYSLIAFHVSPEDADVIDLSQDISVSIV